MVVGVVVGVVIGVEVCEVVGVEVTDVVGVVVGVVRSQLEKIPSWKPRIARLRWYKLVGHSSLSFKYPSMVHSRDPENVRRENSLIARFKSSFALVRQSSE